jgi:serine/threonine protein kinase
VGVDWHLGCFSRTLDPSPDALQRKGSCSSSGPNHVGGIIHRDLKPANIALTVDGSVNVLDSSSAASV